MNSNEPLAYRIRPKTLEEYVGQEHVIGKDKILYRTIKADKLSSEPITAIVLDRGVGGTKLDLLSASVSDARTQIGNTNITYDVLRNGF